MLEGLPIMLALCFMLWHAYYAQNYAGIIDAGLTYASSYIQTLTSIIRLYPNPNVQHEETMPSDRKNKFLYLSRLPAKYQYFYN